MSKVLDYVTVTVDRDQVQVAAYRKNYKGRKYGHTSGVEFAVGDDVAMATSVDAVKASLALKFDQ